MALDKFKDYFELKVMSCDTNCNVEFDMEAAIYEYDALIKDTQL